LTVVAVFVGPAGSGKTTLIGSYSKWLKENLFLRVACVNLDPGAETLWYNPVFDIRRMFTLRDIMAEYGLGPNGAFLKAAELIARYIDEIMESKPFNDLEAWDIVLVDTPGQMETFVFREASTVFFKRLREIASIIAVFVIDATAITSLPDAVVLWFMSVLIQAKLGLAVIPVINKVDQAGRLDLLRTVIEKPEALNDIARKEEVEGVVSDILQDLVSVAVKTQAPLRSVFVSALNLVGIEDMHTLIHEAFCACGDLT